MAWKNTPDKRRQDAANYGPEYRRNRPIAWRRAGGRCEQRLDNGRRCSSTKHCQVDHIIPISQDGTHSLDNLHVLCGQHHAEKTAKEAHAAKRANQAKRPIPLEQRTTW